jgi:tetratricopeptide (TPR) repeat protein
VGLRLVVLLTDLWIGRGHLWEGREWVVSGLVNLRELSGTEWHARIVYLGGRLAYRQNDLQEARRLFGESLALNQSLGNQLGIASALDGLGNVETDVGNYETAMINFKQALEISLREGEVWEQEPISAAGNPATGLCPGKCISRKPWIYTGKAAINMVLLLLAAWAK